MNIPAFEIATASVGMLELVLELTDSNAKTPGVKELRKAITEELHYRDYVAELVAEQNATILREEYKNADEYENFELRIPACM